MSSGPFPIYACVGRVSRFGVIPKNHQPNKRRLIFDLSHPKGYSVNDGIPKELCSMSYITTDDAVRKIVQLGPGSLLAKIDIKSAFRLIPVHPADRHLLAMLWRDSLYIDMCLPFVCTKAVQHSRRPPGMDTDGPGCNIHFALPG